MSVSLPSSLKDEREQTQKGVKKVKPTTIVNYTFQVLVFLFKHVAYIYSINATYMFQGNPQENVTYMFSTQSNTKTSLTFRQVPP